MKQYEAQTPEEALPAWVLVKRQTLATLYVTHELLKEYRRRPGRKNLRRFANNVLDLYLLVKPKLPKLKDGKKLIPRFEGIEEHLAELPEDIDAKEFIGYFNAEIDAIEAIGITKIMLPSTRWGAEMIEGTILEEAPDGDING